MEGATSMIDILVVRTETGLVYSIKKGLILLQQIDPQYVPRKLTVEYEKFFEVERIWGTGSMSKEAPLILGLPSHLEYRFVDSNGNQIKPL
jgi:hypothetical protein